MSRRSRARRQNRQRLPLFAFLALLVLGAGAWWWSQRDEAPAAATATRDAAPDPKHTSAVLALPPVEHTRPRDLAGNVPDVAPPATPAPSARDADALPAFLPPEARQTLALIQRGGPFPHRQDGSVFQNREGRLPRRERGYYREYTVDTPGRDHRGERRIVAGGQPPREYYYSDDHYESFRRFEIGSGAAR
ncbi:ribonuclease [Pseudoxanthomonas sp. LjRoot168]|uniref:ribonuclease domain-containing protein n=1 Tax=unclassified Pseudoxanthomonas TaxID=2645906 RepID=UPI003ECC4EF5